MCTLYTGVIVHKGHCTQKHIPSHLIPSNIFPDFMSLPSFFASKYLVKFMSLFRVFCKLDCSDFIECHNVCNRYKDITGSEGWLLKCLNKQAVTRVLVGKGLCPCHLTQSLSSHHSLLSSTDLQIYLSTLSPLSSEYAGLSRSPNGSHSLWSCSAISLFRDRQG